MECYKCWKEFTPVINQALPLCVECIETNASNDLLASQAAEGSKTEEKDQPWFALWHNLWEDQQLSLDDSWLTYEILKEHLQAVLSEVWYTRPKKFTDSYVRDFIHENWLAWDTLHESFNAIYKFLRKHDLLLDN